jgi:thioredoxin
MKPAAFSRTWVPAILATLLATTPSCEKVKNLSGDIGKMPPARPAVPYSGPLVTELNNTNYASFPNQPGRVVLVDFHAPWCGPCVKLGPLLEKIAAEKNGLLLVGKVDVDKNPEISNKAGVKGIPDVRVYRDGKEIDKFVGLPPESVLRERLEGYLAGLPPVPQAGAATGSATSASGPQPMDKDWMPPGMSRR